MASQYDPKPTRKPQIDQKSFSMSKDAMNVTFQGKEHFEHY
jgi:hypothetical protein